MEVILIIGLMAVAVVCAVALVVLFERLSSAEDKINFLMARIGKVSDTPQVSAATQDNIKPAPQKENENMADLIKRQQERVMKEASPAPKAAWSSLQDNEDVAEEKSVPFNTAKLFSRVGGFALLLAVLFAFRYYADKVPAAARFITALVFGAALLAAGLKSKAQKITTGTLCAAGIAIMYAAFYAAFAFYHIIPISVAFVCMAGVSALAFSISLQQDSPYISFLSVVIAFLTPILLRSGNDMYMFLFVYIAFVNAAAFAVALKKNWAGLIYLSLIFTFLSQLIAVLRNAPLNSCAMFVVYILFSAWIILKYSGAAEKIKKALALFIAANIFLALPNMCGPHLVLYDVIKTFSFAFLANILLLGLLYKDAKNYKEIFKMSILAIFGILLCYMDSNSYVNSFYYNAGLFIIAAILSLTADFIIDRDKTGNNIFDSVSAFLPIFLFCFAASKYNIPKNTEHFLPVVFIAAVPIAAAIRGLFKNTVGIAKGLVLAGLIILAMLAFLTDAVFVWDFSVHLSSFFFLLFLILCGIYIVKALQKALPSSIEEIFKFSFILLPYFLAVSFMFWHLKPIVYDANNFFILLSSLLVVNACFAVIFKDGRPLVFGALGIMAAGAVYYASFLSSAGADIITEGVKPALSALFNKWIAAICGGLLLLPFAFKKRFIQSKEAWAAASFGGVVAFVLIYVSLVSNFVVPSPAIIPFVFALIYLAALLVVLKWQDIGEGIQSFRIAALGGALLFLITAIPAVQLKKEWLTVAFAAEGALLLLLNFYVKQNWVKHTALGLLCVVFARLIINPAIFAYYDTGAKIFNWYLYTYLIAAGAMFAGAKLWRPKEEDTIPVLLYSFCGILLFALVNIEIADFYTVSGPLRFEVFGRFAQTVTYTLSWAVFGSACLGLGIFKRSKALAFAGTLLIAAATLKIFVFDLWSLGALYRIFGLFGIAGVLIFSGMLLEKFKKTLQSFDN